MVIFMTFSKNDTKVVKAVAIIFMLVHHLFGFPGRILSNNFYYSLFKIGNNNLEYYFGSFGKICVTMFIFLSGYGLYVSCKNKTYKETSKYILRKIKQLFTTYWKVFLIFIPICMIFNTKNITNDFYNLTLNFFAVKTTYNPEWWFFTPYILLIALFPIINKIFSNKKSNYFIEIIAIILLNEIGTFFNKYLIMLNIYIFGNQSIIFPIFTELVKLLPGFLIGVFCAKYDLLSYIKEKFSGNILNYIAILLIIIATFCIRYKLDAYSDFILAPIISMSIIILLNNKLGFYIRKVLIKIGNESTNIWLCHSFYCYYLCQNIIYYPKYPILILLWLLLISYLTSIIIKITFSKISPILTTYKKRFDIKTIDN